MCHVALKHFSSAYPFFVQSLKEDSFQLVTLLNLMECSYAIGRYDDLELALDRYLAKYPTDLEMRYCLAAALFKLGKYGESEKHLNLVLSKDPAHRGGKELQQALAAQNKPMRPEAVAVAASPTVESQLGELEGLKRTQQYTLVVERCDEMLKIPTEDRTLREKVLILKADSKALSGYEEDARQLYEQVLSTNPQSSRALSGQGALAAYKNDWDTARSLFTESHALDPRNDAALAGLGLCVRQVNDREGAWGFFSRSLAINPENSGALYGLIEVGHALGRIEDLERHINEYLDLHPGDLDVLHALAECQLALGRRDEAQNTLRTLQIFDPEGLRTRDLSGRLQRYEGRDDVAELPPLR
jgi:tetratricopeptide (TPR) repeat protein